MRTFIVIILPITSGIIWQPDVKHCNKWSGNIYRFCLGATVKIPLAKPAQRTARTRVRLLFNCASFPADNVVKVKFKDREVALHSSLTDDYIFTHELDVSADEEASLALDFQANYNATYPGNCKLELIENKSLPIN